MDVSIYILGVECLHYLSLKRYQNSIVGKLLTTHRLNKGKI